MSKNTLIAAAVLLAGAAFPATAAVTVSSVDGANPYAGPTPTFNFDSATPEYSGTIYSNSTGARAQPLGSTGGYGAVGPGNNQSYTTLDLSGFGRISSITLLWGSVDGYNTLYALGTGFSVQGGAYDVNPANGNQTSVNSNRLVTLTFTGADQLNVTGLGFDSSSQNAFEFDNVTVTQGVPEPANWALLIAGFGMIGGALRRRNNDRAVLA